MGNSWSTPKKKKLRTGVEEKDNINELPDAMLLDILSFLPAKDVVATSVLSKKWRTLWRSVPALLLRRQDFPTREIFHQFVDEVLKPVNLGHVRKVSLHYDDFQEGPLMDWINAVITATEVKHLELYLTQSVQMPSRFFAADHITVLMLVSVKVGKLQHVNLPNLKALRLERVVFEYRGDLNRLLSFPSLEDLTLEGPL